MSKNSITLTEAKRRLSELLEGFGEGSDPITITKNGKAVAVILPHMDYEGLLETIDFLEHPDEVQGVLEGEAQIRRGEYVTLDELEQELESEKRKTA